MKVLPINPRSSNRQNPGLLCAGKAVHPGFPGMGWGSGPEGLAGGWAKRTGSRRPRPPEARPPGGLRAATGGRGGLRAKARRAWDGAAARRKEEATRTKSPPERGRHGPARPRPAGREPRPHSRAPPDWPCAPRHPRARCRGRGVGRRGAPGDPRTLVPVRRCRRARRRGPTLSLSSSAENKLHPRKLRRGAAKSKPARSVSIPKTGTCSKNKHTNKTKRVRRMSSFKQSYPLEWMGSTHKLSCCIQKVVVVWRKDFLHML
ncbi:uncharacterized protein LOC130682665 [Manis pentadactyla]|uniref:uncharacterized protein LOC130682665 n=1 Tax=Manis pentadactyla TaxID=143292 RepID=UPI00255CFA78|nr:uncharacterized protein LOC130682665 [Manis pentadactyla]